MAKFDSQLFHLKTEDGKVVTHWNDWDNQIVAETDWTPEDAEEFGEHLLRMAAQARRERENAAKGEKNEVTFTS